MILELGLMLLPTFAIIFGFLDVGFAIFTWNTLQNAAREGTRYAITMQSSCVTCSQTATIKTQTEQWALGFVTSTATSTTGVDTPYIQVDFYSPSSLTALTGATANEPGNVVEVSIRNYPYKWMFPFSGTMASPFYATPSSNLKLNVYSADVLGGTGLTARPPI